ncbi:MAG: DUF4296 domain-containing protein [Chitinophagaceae bacterium]|jgi:hypothetical protein|nr:DUF4296 domain-containing protein [Chitinophagaceae bacterium]
MAACSGADQPLGFEKMKLVMWDMAKVEGFGNSYLISQVPAKKDSILAMKYAEVLALHKVSEADFFASMQYYRQHPKEYRRLLDSMAVHAERKRQEYYEYQAKPLKKVISSPDSANAATPDSASKKR